MPSDQSGKKDAPDINRKTEVRELRIAENRNKDPDSGIGLPSESSGTELFTSLCDHAKEFSVIE